LFFVDNRRDASRFDINGGLLTASESTPVTLERLYSVDSLTRAASSAVNKLRNQPASKAPRLDSMYYTLEYEDSNQEEVVDEEPKVLFFSLVFSSFFFFFLLLSFFSCSTSLMPVIVFIPTKRYR